MITVKKLKEMLGGVNEDLPVVLRLEEEEAEGFLNTSKIVNSGKTPYNKGDGAFDVEEMDSALYLCGRL